MLRCNIPGFYDSYFNGDNTRLGDCQIFKGEFIDIIDGYCGVAATNLVSRLKALDFRKMYLHISHPHYDHYDGIEKIIDDSYFQPHALYCQDPYSFNPNFSRECASNIAALRRIISKAEKRGIEVIYPKNGDKIVHGDFEVEVYRDQPETADNTDAYINNGSLCYYFPKLRYLTTGDAGLECAIKNDLRPVFVKGGHHGNDLIRKVAKWLWERGCLYYWDNDYSLNLTDFLQTGREDALAVGMTCFNIHGDINFVAFDGKVVIYKGSEHFSYKCGFSGENTLKSADLAIVKSVLKGSLGKMDTRVTNLLDLGYSPTGVQNQVNEIFKLIKG